MPTMTALRAHHRGGPEQLVVEQTPIPDPGAHEVLVAVHAAAITFAELSGDETWGHLPTIPSHEFSGVVHGLGSDATEFEVGDEVFGLVPFDRNGAAADYVTIAEAHLAPRPTSISHVDTAALPLAALTAWQALHDHARLRHDERLLVLGGAGGVGAFAVQLGREIGADVTTTVRGPRAADMALTLGAARVVDVLDHDLGGARFDVVVDTVGGAALESAYDLLDRGGRLVTLQAPPSEERARERGIEAVFFVVAPDRQELGELAAMVDRGLLRIPIAATYPLADGRQAFESGLSTSRAPGKTVLVVRA